ncbi:MAG TPA: nucleotidyltransferase domain-containing protein [Pyrinomonadaceae bacterium]
MGTTTFLGPFVSWMKVQADVVGVALVGSHAREAATEESDVDLVILTVDVTKYLQSQEWLSLFGKVEESRVENWGRLTSIRAFYEDAYEIEYGFSAPNWADVPIDSGTRRVVSNGMKILYDPTGVLEALQKAVVI